MRRVIAAAVVVLAVAATTAGATSSPTATVSASATHVIASGSASGKAVLATAGNLDPNPGTIEVVVSASPNQRVFVTWLVVCERNGVRLGQWQGKYTTRTPARRTLYRPTGHPSLCNVSAIAALRWGRGAIHVTLLDVS
jgi:hypothetical protein